MPLQIRFWGTRGTIPVPGPATLRYGGNTPCVELRSDDALVVLDAGTGIRPLGDALTGPAGGPGDLTVLVSHTHWDHIQGLPFFAPLHEPGRTIRLQGFGSGGASFRDVVGRLMDPSVFPVDLDRVGSRLEIETIGEGDLSVPGFTVGAMALRHPGGALGFRLAPAGAGGPVVSYVTDNELGKCSSAEDRAWRERLVRFLRGSDLLIHDATWSDAEVSTRAGWGHSSAGEAVALAGEIGCARLRLFHHAPDADDVTVDRLVTDGQARVADLGIRLEVEAARDGETLTL